MRTILLLLAAILIAASATPAAEAHLTGGSQRDECTAATPQVACTTGAHLAGGSSTQGFSGLVGAFTGTLESKVRWVMGEASGERSFRCTYANGGLTGACTAAGATAPVGSVFVHVCFSYIAGTSTPGGLGSWGCWVSHT